MANTKIDMLALEQSLAGANEIDIVAMEQNNVDENYAALEKEIKDNKNKIPYPDVEKYSVGIDYNDISDLKYKKDKNTPVWDKIAEIEPYYNDGHLYVGHTNTKYYNNYFMENNLSTRELKVEGKNVRLINTDDGNYKSIVDGWLYPAEDKSVNFSHNITMKKRIVEDVDIVIDRINNVDSEITDAYLRKALIRNKDIFGMHSIIQTIQKKQDEIRSLPADRSFIVQGCAGSGKTMVLLHRLRYLLYNKKIYNDEYLYLAPGKEYKDFTKTIVRDFNINVNNIITFKEYYLRLLNISDRECFTDNSELVFSNKYLSRVYSEKLIKECYRELLGELIKQICELINLCEDALNKIISEEQQKIENEIVIIKKKAVEKALAFVEAIKEDVSVKITNYEDIALATDEISKAYIQKKKEYDEAARYVEMPTISPNDERIINNGKLKLIQAEIEAETIVYEKASIFTKLAHKNKLAKINEKYQEEYEQLVKALIEEEKSKYHGKLDDLEYVYKQVSLSDVERLLLELKSVVEGTDAIISDEENKRNTLNEALEVKYQKEIRYLNNLIEISSELDAEKVEFIDKLMPCYDFFDKKVEYGAKLLDKMKKHLNTDEETNKKCQELKLFTSRTERQFKSYLNVLLFNIIKKKVKSEFEIKICKEYKHYWYLNLYSNYLTDNIIPIKYKYFFIDEAQDLSVSEISLIQKINHAQDNTVVMNLFGDTNQMTSEHGIRNWAVITDVPGLYILNENFRNTNQIVDYCNNNLSMTMEKVGVSLEDVQEYSTLEEVLSENGSLDNNVFVVKDEYAKADFMCLIKSADIKGYAVFTVKEVKGLEFKEVYVFDDDMTRNEKYISYTRALANLNVIHTLPRLADRKKQLIVQGDEEQILDNENEYE